jgi:purine-binding chemotaxis protein CheW
MSNIAKVENTSLARSGAANSEQFLSIHLSGQLFGIPVKKIVDVVKPINLTPIPLAKTEIVGLMNLRGRIVTVVDLRTRLNLTSEILPKKPMFVVVEDNGEIFALIVDEVGEAITLSLASFDKIPENLPFYLRNVTKYIFKLEKELMLVLDIPSVVNF